MCNQDTCVYFNGPPSVVIGNNYCAGLGSQCCDVILVKGRINSENPKGSGFLNGKQMGNRWGGMEMMRSVYEQPGTRVDGSSHSKEGSK